MLTKIIGLFAIIIIDVVFSEDCNGINIMPYMALPPDQCFGSYVNVFFIIKFIYRYIQ